MTTISSEWFKYHNELLGRLAATQESLSTIRPGASLEQVEEALSELQREIDDADAEPDPQADEDEKEEDEEEGDEEE